MKPKAQERGQALVIIALAIVGLFGFSALAIDGSRVFSDRRHAQNAADTSALSAALAKIRGDDFKFAAEDRADSNGYINDADSTVEVNLCSDLKGTPEECPGIPGVPNHPPTPPTEAELAKANHANYVRVKIESTIPATFGRIVGRDEFTNIVTAVAYAGPVKPTPAVNGAAVAALKEDGDKTLFGNGTVNLTVNNSGVFNNSRNNCGTTIAGAGSTYTVSTAFQFVSGTYCPGAGSKPNEMNPVVKTSPVEYPPKYSFPTPSITCSGTGSGTYDKPTNTWTYTPGNYPSGENLSASGGVIFQPGNYCFGDNFTIKGTAEAIANDVKIRITKGTFSLGGASKLTCNNMLVHINGGDGFELTGVSQIHCNDVTFFASTGGVGWDGTTTVRMFAPKGGDYKNLLIYLPFGNSKEITITGTSDNELMGSIIAVSSNIKIAGVSGTKGLHSQIIGYTIELLGHSNTIINYVPEEQVVTINPSAITLTK
jgi:putative Flp pilus-assembly TadE/G-like protein